MGALDPYVHCSCKGGVGPSPVGGIDDWVREANARNPYLTDAARAAVTQAARAISSATGDSSPALTLVTSYPADTTQVRALQAQLNRYVAAPSLGVLARPIPVTGTLDIATAMPAALILLKRARDSAANYGETGAMRAVLEKAGAGVVNPVPYIGADLATATQIIALYGDLKGLPPARPETLFSRVLDNRVVVVAVAAGAFFLLTRKRGRR